MADPENPTKYGFIVFELSTKMQLYTQSFMSVYKASVATGVSWWQRGRQVFSRQARVK